MRFKAGIIFIYEEKYASIEEKGLVVHTFTMMLIAITHCLSAVLKSLKL